jgi:ribosome-binding ATPase
MSARSVRLDESELPFISDLQLLTVKPVLYVCNVDEASAKTGNSYTESVREAIKNEEAEILVITAQMESEIAALETFEEKQMFLADMGLDEPGVNKLIKTAYKLLKLETYFTAGEKEVRAWTITHGTRAPQAAAVIHTDFEKGFIKAEVIAYKDFIHYGSEAACRESGKLRIEGKEYVVQDGDVMHFRFNV